MQYLPACPAFSLLPQHAALCKPDALRATGATTSCPRQHGLTHRVLRRIVRVESSGRGIPGGVEEEAEAFLRRLLGNGAGGGGLDVVPRGVPLGVPQGEGVLRPGSLCGAHPPTSPCADLPGELPKPGTQCSSGHMIKRLACSGSTGILSPALPAARASLQAPRRADVASFAGCAPLWRSPPRAGACLPG